MLHSDLTSTVIGIGCNFPYFDEGPGLLDSVLWLKFKKGCFVCAGFQEYCDGEIFSASCYQPDEVLTITHAQYGLMSHATKCFEVPSSNVVGCYADVTRQVAAECSGRRSCQLRVDGERLKADNCERDFPFFLNASYTCVKGLDAALYSELLYI